MAIFPHGRALVIGVGSYQNPKWNAPITIADAQAVADALQDPAISAYPPARRAETARRAGDVCGGDGRAHSTRLVCPAD